MLSFVSLLHAGDENIVRVLHDREINVTDSNHLADPLPPIVWVRSVTKAEKQ